MSLSLERLGKMKEGKLLYTKGFVVVLGGEYANAIVFLIYMHTPTSPSFIGGGVETEDLARDFLLHKRFIGYFSKARQSKVDVM